MINSLTFRALLLCVIVTVYPSAAYFEGDGTTYTLGGVSAGNCNLMSWNSIAPTNYAALNNEQWDNLGNCGRCALVSCSDEACEDQTASSIVQIVDRCPECKYGDLDLSPSVFKTITGSDPSRLSIRWEFVDCPRPETLKICLKSGSNGFWIAVQPTNAVIGVKSVRINGNVASMISGAYYYLITSSSEVDLTAVDVALTSIKGQVIEGTFSLSAGQCTDTNLQFESTTATPATTSPTSAPTTTAPTLAPTTETPAPTTATPPAVKCFVRRNRH
nr:expansin-like protein EXLX7 [Phytophthora infestans]